MRLALPHACALVRTRRVPVPSCVYRYTPHPPWHGLAVRWLRLPRHTMNNTLHRAALRRAPMMMHACLHERALRHVPAQTRMPACTHLLQTMCVLCGVAQLRGVRPRMLAPCPHAK